MSTADLQDKLTNSNLGNWFILPINSSPISRTRGIDIHQILIHQIVYNYRGISLINNGLKITAKKS